MLSAADPAFANRPSMNPARHLVMVSNRGPIEHYFDAEERIRRRNAAGGVAVAMADIARALPMSWIAAPGSDADRVVAITGQRVELPGGGKLRLVDAPEAALRIQPRVRVELSLPALP